jgi:hypothetical protein
MATGVLRGAGVKAEARRGPSRARRLETPASTGPYSIAAGHLLTSTTGIAFKSTKSSCVSAPHVLATSRHAWRRVPQGSRPLILGQVDVGARHLKPLFGDHSKRVGQPPRVTTRSFDARVVSLTTKVFAAAVLPTTGSAPWSTSAGANTVRLVHGETIFSKPGFPIWLWYFCPSERCSRLDLRGCR